MVDLQQEWAARTAELGARHGVAEREQRLRSEGREECRARAFEERMLEGHATVARNVQRIEHLFGELYRSVSSSQRGDEQAGREEEWRRAEHRLREQLRACLALHVDSLDGELRAVRDLVAAVAQDAAAMELRVERTAAGLRSSFEAFARDGTAALLQNERERRGELRAEVLMLIAQLQEQVVLQVGQLRQLQERGAAAAAARTAEHETLLRDGLAAAESRSAALQQAVGAVDGAIASVHDGVVVWRRDLQRNCDEQQRRVDALCGEMEERVRGMEEAAEESQLRLAAAHRSDLTTLRSAVDIELRGLAARTAAVECAAGAMRPHAAEREADIRLRDEVAALRNELRDGRDGRDGRAALDPARPAAAEEGAALRRCDELDRELAALRQQIAELRPSVAPPAAGGSGSGGDGAVVAKLCAEVERQAEQLAALQVRTEATEQQAAAAQSSAAVSSAAVDRLADDIAALPTDGGDGEDLGKLHRDVTELKNKAAAVEGWQRGKEKGSVILGTQS